MIPAVRFEEGHLYFFSTTMGALVLILVLLLGMGPVGFLITKGEMIQFIPAHNPSGLAAAMEKLPDLIEKFAPRKESVPA